MYNIPVFVIPVVKHWLEWEIWFIRGPIKTDCVPNEYSVAHNINSSHNHKCQEILIKVHNLITVIRKIKIRM